MTHKYWRVRRLVTSERPSSRSSVPVALHEDAAKCSLLPHGYFV
jgi:hypothetical protein